jgi:hypothetical protein
MNLSVTNRQNILNKEKLEITFKIFVKIESGSILVDGIRSFWIIALLIRSLVQLLMS